MNIVAQKPSTSDDDTTKLKFEHIPWTFVTSVELIDEGGPKKVLKVIKNEAVNTSNIKKAEMEQTIRNLKGGKKSNQPSTQELEKMWITVLQSVKANDSALIITHCQENISVEEIERRINNFTADEIKQIIMVEPTGN